MAGFELVTAVSGQFLRPKKVHAGVASIQKEFWKGGRTLLGFTASAG
jgi:hypothetical protein